MYVVKISTLLAPSFQRFRHHEELKAAGMVLEWTEGMGDVIFCSHTWLRFSHLDSEAGDKFALLTGLLRKMQAGKLEIHAGHREALLISNNKQSQKAVDSLAQKPAELASSDDSPKVLWMAPEEK